MRRGPGGEDLAVGGFPVTELDPLGGTPSVRRAEASRAPRCRFCRAALTETFVDLGVSPLANSYLDPDELGRGERFYPLHAYICSECLLVQLEEFEAPEAIFGEYAYFSSYSDSWLEHARRYARMAVQRFALDEDSFILEVASNDGYLLRHFRERGLAVLGVEPATNVAEASRRRGIPTLERYFGEELAGELVADGRSADLVVANNVLAHVPDLNGFVAGLRTVLRPRGVLTLEFPHLLRLIEENQFDTIYHEHFSYFSFLTAERVLASHRLTIFDVEQIPTHGGSLRVYARREEDESKAVQSAVGELLEVERKAGLDRLEGYRGFEARVRLTKRNLLRFLLDARERGNSVVGYGAPAKGNTLLNYCGIRTDLLDYTVDRSPHKQGRYLPGTRIPIYPPARLAETRPDYVLILPWNLRDEITGKMAHVRDWGGRFVVPVPELEILP